LSLVLPLGKQISNPPDLPKRHFLTEAGSYDYIEMAPFEVTITVEADIPDDVILHVLAAMQRLGCGPKRSGCSSSNCKIVPIRLPIATCSSRLL